MTNRPSKNNTYISYVSDLDEIYIDPSEEQSEPYFETLEGQEQQIDESHDKILEEKYEHANHRSHKHKLASKNIPFNTQDSDINSLGYLTKQFMRLLRETKPNQCVDISQAARTLNVQKRRIYDITNVLEGIGYIEKVGKNLMRWVGGTRDQMGEELLEVLTKIQEYENKDRHLNAQIEAMNRKVQQLSQLQNYFTMSELYQLMQKFNCTHMIVYNGYNGIQISVSENTQSGKKEIMIESPPKSTKLGSVYVISRPKQQEGGQVYVIPVINKLCNDQKQNLNQKCVQISQIENQEKSLKQHQNSEGSLNSIQPSQQINDFKNQVEDLSLRQEKQSTLEFQQKKDRPQATKTQKQPGLKSQICKKTSQKEANLNTKQKNQPTKKTFKRNKSINSIEKKPPIISSQKIEKKKSQNLYFQSDSHNENHYEK